MEQLKLMVCFVYKHSHSRWFLKFHVGDDGARICFAFHCASPVVGRCWVQFVWKSMVLEGGVRISCYLFLRIVFHISFGTHFI